MSFEKIRRVMAIAHLCRDTKSFSVLVVLADQWFEDEQQCCPTVDVLMEKARLSRSSVDRAIADLEEDHLIAVDRRYGARHYYTLNLNGQRELRTGPQAVEGRRHKRSTGFRVRPRPESAEALDHPRHRDENPRQPDVGFGRDPSTNPRQPDDATHVSLTKTHVSLTNTLSTYPSCTQEERTATAAPRLPFPLALKPPRPAAQIAQLAIAHRLDRLRRRVAGHALGLLLRPERGQALIHEPITSEATLIAATKELCARKGIHGYGEVVHPMCASVWWRHTLYGQAAIAGRAPRPRDRGRR